jgi:hypothetical protein
MEKFILEDFYFLPFTAIGFFMPKEILDLERFRLKLSTKPLAITEHAFPLLYESIPTRYFPTDAILLQPQAKFRVFYTEEEPKIQTFYTMRFNYTYGFDPFEVLHSSSYDIARAWFRGDVKKLDAEVEVRVCVVSVAEEASDCDNNYTLIHNRQQVYAWERFKNEQLYVVPEKDAEEDINSLIKTALGFETLPFEVEILYLNDKFQKTKEVFLKEV